MRARRQIQGKQWIFDTVVPRAQWEELSRSNGLDRPQINSKDAYEHTSAFWDQIAEKKADELVRRANPISLAPQIEYFWPDFASLKHAFNKFERS